VIPTLLACVCVCVRGCVCVCVCVCVYMYPWDAYSRVSYQKYTPIQKNVMGEFGRISHLSDIGADEAREVRSRLGPEAQVLDIKG